MHPHATQVFSLESIVSKPTWKEILLELIDTKRLEPWKIDIVQIADNYMKKIREMEKISLVIPANIILAASILLRYKSEYLRFEEPVQVIVPLEEGAEFEEMPQLELSARIPPKRQITLDELIQEMEKIIRVSKPDMKIFVAEAITGNDAVEQAKSFNDAIGIDGIILCKADVDEKGGASISASYVTGKPILFLGTGQGYDDLERFNKDKIIKSLGL